MNESTSLLSIVAHVDMRVFRETQASKERIFFGPAPFKWLLVVFSLPFPTRFFYFLSFTHRLCPKENEHGGKSKQGRKTDGRV